MEKLVIYSLKLLPLQTLKQWQSTLVYGRVWYSVLYGKHETFYTQKFHSLKTDDNVLSLDFLRYMLQMRNNNPQFRVLVLHTEEISYTRKSIFNIRNEHV